MRGVGKKEGRKRVSPLFLLLLRRRRRPDDDDFLDGRQVTTKTIENVFKGKTKEHKKVGLGSYC
jgi:hypothetical protein